MDERLDRRSIAEMTALVVLLVVVLGLVWVNRVHRRRRHTDDVHLMRHNAGVFGLGECPPNPGHRMGTAGQPSERRW